jgi:hypothetical protein
VKKKITEGLRRLVPGLAALLVLYLLFALFLTAIHPRFFYHLLYPGAHVSGTVCLTVDGARVPLRAEDFTNQTHEYMFGRRLRVRPRADGSAKITWRAGDYGPYACSLRVPGLDEPIHLEVYQYNNWNVCRFELEILVDREAGTVEYRCHTRTLNEDAHFVDEMIPEEYCHGRLDEPLRFAMLSV